MSDKFRNRFRISISRALLWDYRNGSYFLTICTKNRTHFFGEIIDDIFCPSKIGEIAENHWKEIPDRFRHFKLGVFVIIPNHMHGIINIHGSLHESSDLETNTNNFPVVETRFIASQYFKNHADNISNHPHNISTSNKGGITGIHNPMLYQKLSRVIRWFTADFPMRRIKLILISIGKKDFKIESSGMQKNI